MTERIMTLHPQGKQGVNIERAKYNLMRAAIVGSLGEQGELTFADLQSTVAVRLGEGFEGSINWYVTTVKLDLEARGVVERIPGSRPQRLRLTQTST